MLFPTMLIAGLPENVLLPFAAAPVMVSAGGITGAPVGIFELTGLDNNGKLLVAPNSAPNAVLFFKPTEPRDYTGEFKMRRADSCPDEGILKPLGWTGRIPGL